MASCSLGEFAIMGHRGARGHAPENTLISFERAIEFGATMLELDVHLTRDQEIVVIHDGFLDRTTDGTGPVHEMTLEEIQAFDAGRWFAPEFAGQKVPTLEQVMDLAAGRAELNIEIKQGGIRPNYVQYHVLPELLATLLTDRGWVDRVVISSFHMPYLKQLKKLLPSCRLAYIHHRMEDGLLAKVADDGLEGIHPSMTLVDEELVAAAHEKGLKVRAWTVNETESMTKALESGVDGICTDYPDRLVSLLSTFTRDRSR